LIVDSNEKREFLTTLKLLAESGASFVLIGGLAMRAHGGRQTTEDLDFAYARTRDNAKRIAAALEPYHPVPTNWIEGVPFVWDDQTLMSSSVLTLDTDLGRIYFLAEPEGAPKFQDLYQKAVIFDIEGYEIAVAGIDDLISMKKAAGRPKDIVHLAELASIKSLQEED
jgi:hypothetical protein